MGLTLHHRCYAPDTLTAQAANAIVQRWYETAERFAAEQRIEQVLPISHEPADLERWATMWKIQPHPADAESSMGIQVRPLAGWVFPVEIGSDCELLWIGLCRYPATVTHSGRKVPTALGNGWRFQRSCKTQYASLHGWEHFRRCHVAALDLLQTGRHLGVRVHIEDEGGYWPGCDEAKLHSELTRMNRVVAAMAGALKDEAESSSQQSGAVDSPIFRHPQFERLEAEGKHEHREAVDAAIRAWREDQSA